jgi:hypothetical protein
MFNLKHFKLVKELKNIKPQLEWLQFSYSQNAKKNKLMKELIADNKFVEEDLKIRAMVEDMLEKEFSSQIKNIKSYDFLVESVVNKLKQKQLGSEFSLNDIELK